MALLWFESFDSYGTGSSHVPARCLSRRYSTAYDKQSPAANGRITGVGMEGGYQGRWLTPRGLTSDTTLIVGFAFRQWNGDVSGGVSGTIMGLFDNYTRGLYLWNAARLGELALYNHGNTLLGTTSGAHIACKRWNYIELKVYCHDTAGTAEIRVNGKTRLSLSGIDTKYTGITTYNRVGILGWGGLNYFPWWDDLYVCDSTGATANDFLGPVKVYLIRPASDEGTNEWTPQSGTDHYAMVDEIEANDDTDYLETDGSGDTELFGYQTSPTNVGTIHGVNVCTEVRETDAEAFNIQSVAKRTSTSVDSSVAVGGTSYKVHTRLMLLDTEGAAWTKTNLDATKFGFKLP